MSFPSPFLFLSEHWRSRACCVSAIFAQSAFASPTASQASLNTQIKSHQNFENIYPVGIDLREFQSHFLIPQMRSRIVVDDRILKNSIREVITSIQLEPVFGTEVEYNGRPYLRVIGISDSGVWSTLQMDAMTSLHRLGKMVDTEDERLDGFDGALLNAHPVLAYTKSDADPAEDNLEVIMKSQNALFLVKKASKRSFFIEKIGYIQK